MADDGSGDGRADAEREDEIVGKEVEGVEDKDDCDDAEDLRPEVVVGVHNFLECFLGTKGSFEGDGTVELCLKTV